LIFRLNYSLSGNRTGHEPSQLLSDSFIFSPEIFTQTLQNFTATLPDKRGIEKSLRVKKFIKRVNYSREEIALNLYYKELEDADYEISVSGRAEEKVGRNLEMSSFRKNSRTLDFGSNNAVWLLGLVDVDNK